MGTSEKNLELLECHSEKVRKTIDEIPASLVCWGIAVNLIIFLVLILFFVSSFNC